MIVRKSVVAAAALALALGASACSSEDSNDAADSSAAATTSASDSDGAASDVAAPTAEELTATLDALVDPQKPVDEKITLIENGDERRPNVEAMTNAMQNYPVGFEVTNVQTEGEVATADVAITGPHGAASATPWTWENVDGTWKVSDESTCGLLGMAMAPC
ncbi:hypothetical protein [Rhodococcus sp. NPDC058521]|uniref:hypothetical protein n=1 Tax=Rhodococcus sp. NPDC058521 TaxID=3346536 RepID=UPI0036537ABE